MPPPPPQKKKKIKKGGGPWLSLGTAPLQALRCALCSTEQSTFLGGEKGEHVPRKGEEVGGQQRGQKGKKDA